MKIFKLLYYNPYFNALRNVRAVLDYDQKKRSVIMIFLLLVNAVFDVLGLATIFILIQSTLQDNILTQAVYTREIAGSEMEYVFNSYLRGMYQGFGSSSAIEFLFYVSIIIFLIFVVKNLISLYINYIQTRFAFNVSLRLNKKMFKYFYDQGYLFVKDSSSGKKVYAIVDVPLRFAATYLNQVLTFSTEFVVLIIIAFAIFLFEPMAVLVMAIIIVPTFLLLYQFTKNKAKQIGTERNILAPKNYARVYESMKAFVDVKLSNLENKMLNDYSKSQARINYLDAINYGIFQKLHQKTNDIIFGLGIMVIFAYAYYSGLEQTAVLTLLGVFGISAYRFLPSVNRMMSSILAIKNSSYVIDELQLITNKSLTIFPEVERMVFDRSIDLIDISFRYTDSKLPVLNHFNLVIHKGEIVGIIGSSGSGKTTFLKILLRLIHETEGEIRVDGKKVILENERSFQRNIGYVEQDVFILNDTLLANVAFGVDVPNLDRVQKALDGAMLSEFMQDHSDDINMILGENGVNLSGGQKQRVGIARALYKESDLLVFDEITSALDSETEKAIVESINHLSKLGKTIIIVAHRITTLKNCDRIVEIKQGRIIREPSYRQLIKEQII